MTVKQLQIDQGEPVSASAAELQAAWGRGYFCAVAVLLREVGFVTTEVRSIFEQGGSPYMADTEDRELFTRHGLI